MYNSKDVIINFLNECIIIIMSLPAINYWNSPTRGTRDFLNQKRENSNKSNLSFASPPRATNKFSPISSVFQKKIKQGKRKLIDINKKNPLKCVDAYTKEKELNEAKEGAGYSKYFKSLQPKLLNFCIPNAQGKSNSRVNSRMLLFSPMAPSSKLLSPNKSMISRTPSPHRFTLIELL